MITKILKSAVLVLMFVSCNNNTTPEQPKEEIPKALQEKSLDYEIVSKRNDGDIIESLYNEHLSKDTTLQKLENTIEDLNKYKGDSTALFNKFDDKNESYFSSADAHIASIKDSLIKNKLKDMVSKQLTKYHFQTAKHKDLLNLIDVKQMAITDLYTVLKIATTLPMIDKYQKDNLPNTKSLEGYMKRQEEVIKIVAPLTEKHL